MSLRGLSTAVITAVTGAVLYPALLFDLTFMDNTYHFWCGMGSLVVNATTYIGVGTLGKVSTMGEGTSVEAKGITLTLSGIDPTLLAESMAEINLATRAVVSLAFLQSTGVLVGVPQILFSGIMDGPVIDMDTTTASISIDVENKLVDMNRARGGRLTDQDQKSRYPLDQGLGWVSYQADRNIIWRS